MKEVIQLYFGGYGVNQGIDFNELLCEEHDIDNNTGLVSIDESDPLSLYKTQFLRPYFNEIGENKYKTRSIFLDSSSESLNLLKVSSIAAMLEEDNILEIPNFAEGIYIEAKLTNEQREFLSDTITLELECCNYPQAFEFGYSTCGGIGVLPNRTAELIKDLFPKIPIVSYCQTGDKIENSKPLAKLNDLFHFGTKTEYDMMVLFQNEIISSYLYRDKYITNVDFKKLNRNISRIKESITSVVRYPSQNISSYMGLINSLVPVKEAKIVGAVYSPNIHQENLKFKNFKQEDVLNDLLSLNYASGIPISEQKILTSAILMRGEVSPHYLEQSCYRVRKEESSRFIDPIPNTFSISFTPHANKEFPISGCAVFSTIGIVKLLQDKLNSYNELKMRKSYFFRYTDKMSEELFDDAEAEINEQIGVYDKILMNEAVLVEKPWEIEKFDLKDVIVEEKIRGKKKFKKVEFLQLNLVQIVSISLITSQICTK